MPDSKITALTSISTSTDPANDPLVIVDVSDTSMAATGTTKKVTLNQLLGASGTATLASATITGDLTVDTSTLKVDSANNRVGIGTASPTYTLHLADTSASSVYIRFQNSTLNNGFIGYNSSNALEFLTGGVEQYRIAPLGVFNWYDGAGGTRMTLNSTGLGIGMGPANNLSIGSATYASFGVKIDSITQSSLIFKGTPDAAGYEHAKIVSGRESSPFTYGSFLAFYTEGKNSGTTDTSTERLRIDSSGNVGIGVTPSATLDVYTSSGDCTAQFKSNAAGSNVISTLDYVSSYGITRIKKSGTTVWETGVIGSTSATPSYSIFNASSIGVYLTSGGTSWTGISDERLKDIIEPISNAVQKVGSLRSVIGKFKNDETNTRRSFLIAQDVQAVLPEAVNASNPDRLGVAYTDVIPLLVAAIKELTAEVNALKNA